LIFLQLFAKLRDVKEEVTIMGIRKRQKRTHRGFTLIELVIVITILAILAAVAIPAFQNLTTQARNAGVQGALGGLRSAIALYRANELAQGRAGNYPTVNQVEDVQDDATTPKAMENGETPDNPWCTTANSACDSDGVTAATQAQWNARTVVGSSAAGWAYYVDNGVTPPEAGIYANSSANNDTPTENNF